MSLCFVDTNILIYARDPSATEKAPIARDWIGVLAEAGRIVVSPQVMNEFAQNVLWKLPDVSVEDVAASMDILKDWCPMAMTAETTLSALALHRRYGYTVYDSANLAMALDAGCGLFLSETLQNRQTIAGMTILDPFKADMAELDTVPRR